jgi:hypothetical protein
MGFDSGSDSDADVRTSTRVRLGQKLVQQLVELDALSAHPRTVRDDFEPRRAAPRAARQTREPDRERPAPSQAAPRAQASRSTVDILSDDDDSDSDGNGGPFALASARNPSSLHLSGRDALSGRRTHAVARRALEAFDAQASVEARALEERIRELKDDFRLRLHTLEKKFARDVESLSTELTVRVQDEKAKSLELLEGRASHTRLRHFDS